MTSCGVLSIENKKDYNDLIEIIETFENSLQLLQKIQERDKNCQNDGCILCYNSRRKYCTQISFIKSVKDMIMIYKVKINDFNADYRNKAHDEKNMLDKIASLEDKIAKLSVNAADCNE